ncbi:MAG: Orotidine 5-phosphate decarboxylase subfamily 1 core [Firmicutes bacterium]|nr:Orotidine 5-phosphate decarboxylase subfamily 1 core [Bacillota bacterium]
MSMNQRLIVALDCTTMEQVQEMVAKLGDSVQYYKVGMELYYSVGRQAIQFLRQQNKEVFLDLKLHDIPNTVARSASVLTHMGATMFNVHASGGPSMMKATAIAVAEAAENAGIKKPKLIAVTILTSMDEPEWRSLGYNTSVAGQALHLARLVKEVGLDGVVASPHEAKAIRKECGPEFLIVTPGIRPVGSASNDQSRIATPGGALRSGASHLVVGRPITGATDPKAAALAIIREMEEQ